MQWNMIKRYLEHWHMAYNGNNFIENFKCDITWKSLLHDNMNMGLKENKYYLTSCNIIVIYIYIYIYNIMHTIILEHGFGILGKHVTIGKG